MNDDVKADVKAAVELWRETTDKTCSCIDCVAVRTILAHLDAEPARIAAAVAEERRAVTLVTRGAVYWDGDRCLSSVAGSIAAAREEQRALDLEAAEWGAEWCSCQSEIAKASLNATPLADRIAELLSWPCESHTCKRALADVERAEGGVWYCWECWNTTVEAVRRRAEEAEARVAELEAGRREWERNHLNHEADDAKAERDEWKERAEKAEARIAELAVERDALKAQVERVRSAVDAVLLRGNGWPAAAREAAQAVLDALEGK